MEGDPEIDAMSAVASALEPLDEDAQSRVLAWAARRYGVTLGPSGKAGGSGGNGLTEGGLAGEASGAEAEVAGVSELAGYEDFADLYDVVDPMNEEDRALVGAYWWQVIEDQGSFTGYQVNESLRNMGHEVSNVTRSLARLQKRQPALVRQMAKSGKSKQARKTYKLTNAGIKAVEAMLQ